MNKKDLKIGQTVYVKGIITDIEKDEILNLEIHTSENNFYVNSSDVYASVDQPKPVVPQFVADWIEIYKEKRCRLSHALKHVFDDVELGLYIKQQEDDYTEIIAKAWLYGYTVQKEKLYQIIDKRLNATFSCLGYDIEDRVWFWGNKKFFLKNKGVRLAHTRQQLIDAGFEEVFKNPNYEAPEVTE
ncbi:TPA: DUF1642 domain-containing protein [Escherichia coli]